MSLPDDIALDRIHALLLKRRGGQIADEAALEAIELLLEATRREFRFDLEAPPPGRKRPHLRVVGRVDSETVEATFKDPPESP